MSRLLLPLLAIVAITFTLSARPPRANPFRGDEAPVKLAEPEGDVEFKKGHFREAATWYASVAATDPKLLDDAQRGAWAFCRVKLAAEIVNLPACDAKAAASAEQDVLDALQLAPNNIEVQKLGQAVLLLARTKACGPRETSEATLPQIEAIETASFTVRCEGSREIATKIAEVAEAKRAEIFGRWSGPAGGAWVPHCEIVVHASAEKYAAATKRPAEGTGHATVRLADGKATERRIDLRADDVDLLVNALPRELTHVVLADLFPYTPPPKWAEEGMAVLACTPDEISRYSRTMAKCAREGKLFTVVALLEMKEFPASEKITGFYCGSVSLTEHLVKLKGEKHFTTFLRDCQRYGSVSALKRQYDIESPKALQDAWLKSALK